MDAILEKLKLKHLQEVFRENNIDQETFVLLGNNDIKELVPKIGDRVKITKYLQEEKEKHQESFTFSLLDPDLLDTLSVKTVTSEETTSIQSIPEIQTILENVNRASLDGRVILKEGQSSQGLLKEGSRRKLSQLIINNTIEGNPGKKITTAEFYKLSTEIVSIFPKESVVVYYSAYVSGKDGTAKKNASGKLYETYISIRRKLRQSGELPGTSRTPSRSSNLSPVDDTNREEDEEHKDNFIWLKNNVDPWTTVEQKWAETSKHRLKKLYDGHEIAKYFNDFPALRQPQGYTLLLEDFKSLYPGKETCLFSMIVKKKDEIIAYARNKAQQTRDKHCSTTVSNLIGLINEEDPESIKNVSLMLLAYIINISAARKRKGQPVLKFSRAEICDAYIKQVNSEVEVTNTIISKREQVTKQGRTLQPFIIYVGQSVTEVLTAYVVINENIYQFNKLITAVDCAFKVFQSTGACYPEECADIWLFIQIGFFNIHTKFDKATQAVNTLLTDLGLINNQ